MRDGVTGEGGVCRASAYREKNETFGAVRNSDASARFVGGDCVFHFGTEKSDNLGAVVGDGRSAASGLESYFLKPGRKFEVKFTGSRVNFC